MLNAGDIAWNAEEEKEDNRACYDTETQAADQTYPVRVYRQWANQL